MGCSGFFLGGEINKLLVFYSVTNVGVTCMGSEGHPRQNELSEIGQRSWKQSSEWLPRQCGKRYVFAETSQFLVSPNLSLTCQGVYTKWKTCMEDMRRRKQVRNSSSVFFILLFILKMFEIGSPFKEIFSVKILKYL